MGEAGRGCVLLTEIAPLKILFALNGDSASAPLTNQEGQTAGVRVAVVEEVEEPVDLMLTVLKQIPFAQNGVSASVLNTSQETKTAILDRRRGSLVFIFQVFSLMFSKLFLHA